MNIVSEFSRTFPAFAMINTRVVWRRWKFEFYSEAGSSIQTHTCMYCTAHDLFTHCRHVNLQCKVHKIPTDEGHNHFLIFLLPPPWRGHPVKLYQIFLLSFFSRDLRFKGFTLKNKFIFSVGDGVYHKTTTDWECTTFLYLFCITTVKKISYYTKPEYNN